MTPGPNIIFTFPRWEVSGVTTLNLDLAVALHNLGAHCQFVVEEDNRKSCPYDLPPGIPCHDLLESYQWLNLVPSNRIKYWLRSKLAQHRLWAILALSCPVVLIPGYAHWFATPRKPWPGDVGVFGVVHANDDTNVNFAVKHGRDWACCICVSDRVAAHVKSIAPWIEPILRVIQNGVACSSNPPAAREIGGNRPLRIVYAGRLAHKQKRIFDLVDLVDKAAEKNIPIQWDIAGEGPDEMALRERLTSHIKAGTVHWHGTLKRSAVRDLFRQSDAMILLSEYEGMPMCLLESMAEGCVPIISEGCDAGADLVCASEAGYILPTGDLERFATVLKQLQESPERISALSHRAWSTIAHGPHNAVAMGAAYYDEIMTWFSRHSWERIK